MYNKHIMVWKRGFKMIKLTEEEKETLSYDDVAYLILKEENKNYKIQDLFKKVIKTMELPENIFEEDIEEFFELIITDKRLTMLDNGYIDLKINHSTKMIIEEDEEEELVLEPEEINEQQEDNYDDESNPEEDTDNDLQDLVIIDEDNDELESDMM